MAAAGLVATGVAYRGSNRAGSQPIETATLPGLSPATTTPGDLERGFRTAEPMSTLRQVGNYSYLTDLSWQGDIDLVLSARTERDIIFRDELDALSRRHPNLHVTVTLTRED